MLCYRAPLTIKSSQVGIKSSRLMVDYGNPRRLDIDYFDCIRSSALTQSVTIGINRLMDTHQGDHLCVDPLIAHNDHTGVITDQLAGKALGLFGLAKRDCFSTLVVPNTASNPECPCMHW